MTFSASYNVENYSTEEKVSVYTDACAGIEELYCTIERNHIKDNYFVDEYNTTTIYIEKTWQLK